MCERHNAVIKRTLAKVRADEPTADLQLLLDLACLAKHSLLVHGSASPHQLMCGTQPRLPSAVHDAPPALSDVRVAGDENLQQTLRSLTRSRVAFLQAEADQSLRRELARKPRSPGASRWTQDAKVFYWHTAVSAGTSGWRGPARVGGHTGRQVLLRHGGQWMTRDTGALIPAPSGTGAAADPLPLPGVDPGDTAANPTSTTVNAGEDTAERDNDQSIPDLIEDSDDEGSYADGADDTDIAPSADAAMWAGIAEALATMRAEEDSAPPHVQPISASAVAAGANHDEGVPAGSGGGTLAEEPGIRRYGRPRHPVDRLGEENAAEQEPMTAAERAEDAILFANFEAIIAGHATAPTKTEFMH